MKVLYFLKNQDEHRCEEQQVDVDSRLGRVAVVVVVVAVNQIFYKLL